MIKMHNKEQENPSQITKQPKTTRNIFNIYTTTISLILITKNKKENKMEMSIIYVYEAYR